MNLFLKYEISDSLHNVERERERIERNVILSVDTFQLW